MTTYWFNLNPETFLWKTEQKCIMYNTKEQKCLSFDNNKKLDTILLKFLDIENMYCIQLNEEDVNDNGLKPFISQVVNLSFGSINPVVKGELKPVFFVPKLKLQGGIDTKLADHFVILNDNMMIYLHEINIILNSCDGINSNQGKKITNLPYSALINFFQPIIKFGNLKKIEINATNILKYPEIGLLIDELMKYEIQTTFCISMNCIHDLLTVTGLKFLKSNIFKLQITYRSDMDKTGIAEVSAFLKDEGIVSEWNFEVDSENSFEQSEEIIDNLQLKDYTVKPFFNGNNISFFENNIYLTKEDFMNMAISKREIFAHQVLNTNFFGKIIIKPNGDIHTSLYTDPIGHINDHINDTLLGEMKAGTTWRKIRDQKPCNKCIYQWLCPSPSNFEQAIGKPNLCHITA
jgi:pseudo-rSAM protein